MENEERIGAYYIPKEKKLILGIPQSNLSALKNPRCVVIVPFREITQNAKLSIKDIETLYVTNSKNFQEITSLEANKEALWDEFQEFLQQKREKEAAQSKVLPFTKEP